jgi:RNA polymerase sigma-70 factor (ECF subfamily)
LTGDAVLIALRPITALQRQALEAADDDERPLIAASLAGDDDAFRLLVERHYRLILRLAYRAFCNLPAAEDCAQEVFIKVHKNLRSYRADKPFVHWLHRVAANTVTDTIRRRRIDLPLDALAGVAPSWLADPAEAAVVQEQRVAVRKAMADLPRLLRDAIALRVFHELSYQEIAEVLNIPIGTVMSRIHNAKRLLRRDLAEYITGVDDPWEANRP